MAKVSEEKAQQVARLSALISMVVALVMTWVGVVHAWDDLLDDLRNGTLGSEHLLLLVGVLQFLLIVAWFFRAAYYVERWQGMQADGSRRRVGFTWLHPIALNPYLTAAVGAIMILAALPKVWTEVMTELDDVATAADYSLLAYGLYQIALAAIPQVIGLTYIRRARTEKRPSAS